MLVTQEIPITGALIAKLPARVQLICEAGTGFNNVALGACRAQGIAVASVPTYSAAAVASLVMICILNFSSGLMAQQYALWRGDKSHFTASLGELPFFELEGKVLGLVGGRGGVGSRVAKLGAASARTRYQPRRRCGRRRGVHDFNIGHPREAADRSPVSLEPAVVSRSAVLVFEWHTFFCATFGTCASKF